MRTKLIFILGLIVFLSSGEPAGSQTTDFDSLALQPGIFQGYGGPKKNESEAIHEAVDDAYKNLAASISSFVNGTYEIKQVYKGINPDDVMITITGDLKVTVRLPLSGVEQVAKLIERTEDGYKARVLVQISPEGRLKAEKYIEQETKAARVYHFFAGKIDLSPVAITDVPPGYPDFSTWFANRCISFEMNSGGDDFLTVLDTFFRKLSGNITIFADVFDEKPVRVVYNNTPDRFQEFVTALEKNNIRVSMAGSSRLLLSPDISLRKFKEQVGKMPDAGEIVIAGISSYNNSREHISSPAINEAAYIAGRDFGLHAQVARLPDQCLNGAYNDTQIIKFLDRKTSPRYAILIKSTAVLEPGIEVYRIPAYYRLAYQCFIYDFLMEKGVYSGIVNNVDFSSAPGSGSGKIPACLINSVLKIL